ncbi:MAG: WbqC family protein [Paludibacteraceae bacterium]|nr:WbqC family protein [Paludibacteraceae bacterium]
MIILPTTYLGPVEWYRQFMAHPSEVAIEVMESFPKQTYRNRCTITVPGNGYRVSDIGERLTLTVPIKRANSKQLTKDVEISYQQKWQHQHWIALVSAYKRTPYFDYYADFFRPFYEKETKFLVDLNEGLHEVIMGLVNNCIELGSSGVELFSTKEATLHNATQHYTTLHNTTDWQGLDLEHCFGNGQSILDMLFEYGPETIMKI